MVVRCRLSQAFLQNIPFLLQLIKLLRQFAGLLLPLLRTGLPNADLIASVRFPLLVVGRRLGQSILHRPEFLTLILQASFQVSVCLLPFIPLLLESADLFL